LKDNEDISSNDLSKIFDAKLTDQEFNRLSDFIHTHYGIKMPPVKKVMLQSRLQKRLRALGITSFEVYVKYVFSKEGQDEVVHMMDVVSTNKTDFFREPAHFDFMKTTILPEFMSLNKTNPFFKVWSAGSSSGEEAYTIAMVLSEFQMFNPGFDFKILGTDISTRILKTASEAIYQESKVDVVSLELKRKYLLRSRDKDKKMIRIIPQLRNKVSFERLNFMDSTYNINETFDLIFCRNVLIYFDRDTQENVINKLCRNLKADGYFYLGHSESITGIDAPLKHIKPTIFKKK